MKPVRTFLTFALVVMSPSLAGAQPFKQVLKMQGIVFNVESPNKESGNSLWIVPSGLTESEKAIHLPVAGVVKKAQVADLNKDGSPELYVSVNRLNGRNFLVAYAANHKKSLSQVTLPALQGAPDYLGDDVFSITDTGLKREFQTPKGPHHQYYTLKQGANGWLLSPVGRVTPNKAASNKPPARPKVPEIRARSSGELEVLMPKGGVLLYSKSGRLMQKGGSVSEAELDQANKAVRAYLKEQ
jgi:hypothetical protein